MAGRAAGRVAAQILDEVGERVFPGATTGEIDDFIRSRVEGPGTDRYLAPEIEAVVELAASGALVDAAERVAGELG